MTIIHTSHASAEKAVNALKVWGAPVHLKDGRRITRPGKDLYFLWQGDQFITASANPEALLTHVFGPSADVRSEH